MTKLQEKAFDPAQAVWKSCKSEAQLQPAVDSTVQSTEKTEKFRFRNLREKRNRRFREIQGFIGSMKDKGIQAI